MIQWPMSFLIHNLIPEILVPYKKWHTINLLNMNLHCPTYRSINIDIIYIWKMGKYRHSERQSMLPKDSHQKMQNLDLNLGHWLGARKLFSLNHISFEVIMEILTRIYRIPHCNRDKMFCFNFFFFFLINRFPK